MRHVTIQHASSRPELPPRPLHAFISIESAGGLLLLAAGVTAIIWTNSAWGDGYRDFWDAKLSVGFASFAHVMTLGQWVTDGLMVGFFLLIGLEIKRQFLFGELATLRRAALPTAGAIGGMVAPVLLYASLNVSEAGAGGWAVPMATDIALAVGILVLVGRSLPIPLKAYLLAGAAILATAGGSGERCAPLHQG